MQSAINQLKELKKIKPDAKRQQAQKARLMQQVSAQARTDVHATTGILLYTREFFSHELSMLVQPMAMVAVLALLVVSGGIFSITAASEATPGSFLYTVKLVGEKTQFALTSNQADKVKLSVSFVERRVNEISTIARAQNHEELEKVAANLVSEIMTMQTGLDKIENERSDSAIAIARDIDSKASVLRDKLVATKKMLANSTDITSKKIDDAIAGVDAAGLRALTTIVRSGETTGTDVADVSQRVASKIENAKEKVSTVQENLDMVFSAGLGRSEQGVQIYRGTGDQLTAQKDATAKTQAAGQVIAEAEQLLSDNNYAEALEKVSQGEALLQEAAQAAGQPVVDGEQAISSSTPEVKGVTESNEIIETETSGEGNATSTEQ